DGDFGVWKLWAELSTRWPSFEFTHSFGLGVLGVGSDFPERVRTFFQTGRDAPAALRAYFANLGHHVHLIKQARYWTRALDDQRRLLNEWRQRTGQPPNAGPNPSAEPLGAIRPLMLDFIKAI